MFNQLMNQIPVANAQIILNELNKFSQELSQLPQILVLNKIDQIPNEQRDAVCQDIITRLGWTGEVFYTSTLTGEGLEAVKHHLMQVIEDERERELEDPMFAEASGGSLCTP